MLAKELMRTDVMTVREDMSVEDLMDMLVGEHLHGAPVVDDAGALVGIVTQQDVFFGTMVDRRAEAGRAGPRRGARGAPAQVKDIMTAPAVSAGEETEIVALCRLMYRLRIHRVPIVRAGAVTGIVSSLDVCSAVARGEKLDQEKQVEEP